MKVSEFGILATLWLLPAKP